MMDGVHDLGGKQGFGPVQTSTDDPAFTHEWEGRYYALNQEVASDGLTIDWFRNMVELMPPHAYLTEPYFQKWLLVQLVDLLQAGMITWDEALTGKPAQPADPAPARTAAEVLEMLKGFSTSFARTVDTAPRFAVGDTIRTQRHMAATHTRLPGYARDRIGTVIGHHGGHVFADAHARGQDEAQHLYTVAFSAQELWGDTASANDDVTLDLWESYLVPA